MKKDLSDPSRWDHHAVSQHWTSITQWCSAISQTNKTYCKNLQPCMAITINQGTWLHTIQFWILEGTFSLKTQTYVSTVVWLKTLFFWNMTSHYSYQFPVLLKEHITFIFKCLVAHKECWELITLGCGSYPRRTESSNTHIYLQMQHSRILLIFQPDLLDQKLLNDNEMLRYKNVFFFMVAWEGLENLHWNTTWHLATGNDKTQKKKVPKEGRKLFADIQPNVLGRYAF